jgi:phosphate transport system protein
MTRHFEEELDQLKSKLLEMSLLVTTAIHRSIEAVIERDSHLAEEVLKNEEQVNAMEIEIDDLAIQLLALQHPLAADLRLTAAALKINNDLERMGDHAVNIAERAIDLVRKPSINPMIDIPHIAALVESMVHKSLDSFVTRDIDLARNVLVSDDVVDDLRNAFLHELIRFMEKSPENIPQAVNLMSVIRNLERIADHSTNIAEDVLFYVKGIDVRHHAEFR